MPMARYYFDGEGAKSEDVVFDFSSLSDFQVVIAATAIQARCLTLHRELHSSFRNQRRVEIIVTLND
jgi:hypothetical protein